MSAPLPMTSTPLQARTDKNISDASTIPAVQEKLAPPQPTIDPRPEDIPNIADAKSFAEAIRIVVMTRLVCDRQTRDARVNPILLANMSYSSGSADDTSPTDEQLVREVTSGKHLEAKIESFSVVKPVLVQRFGDREVALLQKNRLLRTEYLSLHERWLASSAVLDQDTKPGPELEVIPSTGRTTRRSTAALGDAVRSDLEMEQIIASLGIDEATDPNQLSQKNLAIIPDMISVTHGRVDYVFDDTNHFVTNPSDYFAPYTGIHDWTDAEKEIFLDKFAAFPKQFGIIADYLPNKSAAQCVDYYYLHKKQLIDFRKIVSQYAPNKRKRRRTGKQKGNALLTDIREHDAEVHRDLASTLLNGRQTRARKQTVIEQPRKPSRRTTVVQFEGNSTATPTPEPETRPKRRRVIPTSRMALAADDGDEDGTVRIVVCSTTSSTHAHLLNRTQSRKSRG